MIRKRHIILGLISIMIGWYIMCLPETLFEVSYSKVLYSSDGNLLNAQTAKDGQWRFPCDIEVPEKFEKALLTFEDKRFFNHIGIDLISIGRAMIQNLKERRIVSGGSTLTMQLMRMSRGNKSRSIGQKILEIILATRSEIRYSKQEILKMYAGHAPFGGNVVGLQAASWRYFGKNSENLTWAESAMLAVLPNAPSLIHPGKNRTKLIEKRNRLLERLFEYKAIDRLTYATSLLEEIPEKPRELPNHAYHLAMREAGIGLEKTTINSLWQIEANTILQDHHQTYKAKGIQNAAIVVVDNATRQPCIYIGNNKGFDHEKMVDMVTAPRSSGSILKPLLYGLAIEEGIISPDELLPDYPLNIDGFNPKNYNKEYYGAVKASEALSRSLNVPMVALLRKYGVENFHKNLKEMGLTSLHRNAEDYGLSLILGGAEVKLSELVQVYASFAAALNDYGKEVKKEEQSEMSAGTIYLVFEAMKKVVRPDNEGFWETFSSSQPIAWKTGTSYGHRDAWAIGINKDYTVGVWVGNADGEGRSEIVGSTAAGSLMFDIWNILPKQNKWFDMPHDELRTYNVCKKSGHQASLHCSEIEKRLYPKQTKWTKPCPYHQHLFLNQTGKFRTYLDCDGNAIDTTWFVLPPSMAYYYKKNHPDYVELPPLNVFCDKKEKEETMNVLYPAEREIIYVPRGMNGKKTEIIFQAVHKKEDAQIYWHIDGEYKGKTEQFHFFKIFQEPGEHRIMIMDKDGNKITRSYLVGGKESAMME